MQGMYVERAAAKKIKDLAKVFKAVALIGPRQSGKTTLAKSCFPDKVYVSLETPENREYALTDPIGFLNQYQDGAILDEIQRAPELLSYLQERLDNTTQKGLFILTGSNKFSPAGKDHPIPGRQGCLPVSASSLLQEFQQGHGEVPKTLFLRHWACQ